MDVHWFSLFFWPDVHPHVTASALKLLSALLCGSPRFKQAFLSAAASSVSAAQAAAAVASLDSVGLGPSSSLAPAPQPVSAVTVTAPATALAAMDRRGAGGAGDVAPGFKMLGERLPYARPSWEAYAVLFGLLVGKTPDVFDLGYDKSPDRSCCADCF